MANGGNELLVKAEWLGKRQFRAKGASGFDVIMDASVANGGESSGNRPMELVLMSVIGCMGMGVAGVLDKMRKPPKALEIEVEGTRSAEHPKRLTEIKLTFRVQGDMAPERLWRAVQLELEKYCPVVASLNAAVIPHIVLNGTSVTPNR
ncbi:OsmC family protein [Paenibacillus contaminans]|uniref:OsmC family peroxiredoxin n=1 Tax=Paenibacillus contaminans TaxID=450362 RepID=A0A329MPE1_9BACL|nr:OsmC family protein [Paenibacillus contaminans]RAV21338.1 OsmC family peroxiredoxin [Paenibacillus contaminans]